MSEGAKYADSRRMSVVLSLTAEFRPPITPASATGFMLSQMTVIPGSMEQLSWLREMNEPLISLLTITFPPSS